MTGSPLPLDLTADELRARTVAYREMARTSLVSGMLNSLLRLADRFEDLAQEQEDAEVCNN